MSSSCTVSFHPLSRSCILSVKSHSQTHHVPTHAKCIYMLLAFSDCLVGQQSPLHTNSYLYTTTTMHLPEKKAKTPPPFPLHNPKPGTCILNERKGRTKKRRHLPRTTPRPLPIWKFTPWILTSHGKWDTWRLQLCGEVHIKGITERRNQEECKRRKRRERNLDHSTKIPFRIRQGRERNNKKRS